MKRPANRRKNQKGDGIQNKNSAERDAHFFVVGMENGADGGDGAAAADGRASGDEKRGIASNSQDFSESETRQERERNSKSGVDEAAAAGFQHFVQVHSEAKSDDADLKKDPGRRPRGPAEGMHGKRQTKENAECESYGRRKKSCEGKEESEKK